MRARLPLSDEALYCAPQDAALYFGDPFSEETGRAESTSANNGKQITRTEDEDHEN